MIKKDCGEAGCAEGRCGTESCLPSAAGKVPGMAVQALAAEIVAALLADEKDGGYDLTAGMFGPAFSTLIRRWAALEYAVALKPRCQACNYQHGHAIGCTNNPVDIALKEQRRRDAFDSLPDDYEVN